MNRKEKKLIESKIRYWEGLARRFAKAGPEYSNAEEVARRTADQLKGELS